MEISGCVVAVEVITKILRRLTPYELASVRMVSKRWHKIVMYVLLKKVTRPYRGDYHPLVYKYMAWVIHSSYAQDWQERIRRNYVHAQIRQRNTEEEQDEFDEYLKNINMVATQQHD